ncbi:ribosomal-protein-alanine N-acetyltransferase [Tessaracoccus bendigoensis DSM 12906]|uniref:Ribosomal-protein-alanine N-acetyltransferase n=1 Tax=Tessaracoccus bendigoensis DSM 12906 TaxID=1123357 RepID=A0A1M6MY61_9ACTN|nr:GNAT family N-acetyltransferase [Tessaracoccus bendigoensis]SHJ88352.1 ribosomal-protein-alanine N-acetyltransferase [Tessaracoccus bendigoensis DSM 12906]
MMVEPAASGDLAAITALETNFGVPWSEDAWRAELEGDGRLVLVARMESGEVVGAACFQLVDDVADLHRIVVSTTRRRLGLARVMLVSGLRWAIGLGASRMLLEVEHDNAPAVTLYRGYGFHEVARRADYYGPGADALVLERFLEGVDVDSVGMWDVEDMHE